ncbi:hypothetical protein ACH5RR_007776 [Cinchona calisaya]|uniref:Glycosyltransferase N-terminal domain-containing protein n=1 Tax=Cinchona calisaya TaxID=153742 RepID=A0ABD3AB63_9GENT
MGKQTHVLAIPCPAQGHVTPLLKLSNYIASHGIKVTFVNTEFIHAKIIAAMPVHESDRSGITLTSIPDGLEHNDDRKDFIKCWNSIQSVMPLYLTDLIEKINRSNADEQITCVIADASIGWILEVADKLGIKKLVFLPAGPAGSAFLHNNIPKLIETGLIDCYGNLTRNEQISLSDDIPPWNNMEFPWSFPGDLKTQKHFLECFLTVKRAVDSVDLLLCNTCYELDKSSCDLITNILPIGPLITNNHAENSASSGSFWPEDTACLSWLDRQQVGSVVYVAFGSIAVISQQQFDELALGLELSARPFLWVVRADLANGSGAVYPSGFLDRVADQGKIVEWAPQEKVLAHPSIPVS